MVINDKIGLERIKKEFDMLYPNHQPKYYGKQVRYKINEDELLDAIMVYELDDYYHFVTLGFSELYEKETDNLSISGLGFELTYKLYKNDDNSVEEIINLLQKIAKDVFEKNKTYNSGDYIIINNIKFVLDEYKVINTENGIVKLLELKK